VSKKKIEKLRDFLSGVYIQYLRVTEKRASSGRASKKSNTYVGLCKGRDDLEFA